MDLNRLKRLLIGREGRGEAAMETEIVSRIVNRMKEKYERETKGVQGAGVEGGGGVGGVFSEARRYESGEATKYGQREASAYAPGEKAGYAAKAFIKPTPKDLAFFESPMVRIFGKFYVALEAPLSKISALLYKQFGRKLESDLAAADMNFTVEQYISLALSAAILGMLCVLGFLFFLFSITSFNVALLILITMLVPFGIVGVAFIIPANKAKKIAREIDKELPFALRHMSIEIRAGIGIFKTMELIEVSGYGYLSKGFGEVLSNIEKGMSTEDALEKWMEKSRSEGLNRMISHLVRALRTGGNLSEIMVTIAEDVSFERRMRIADFAEKLNLMGLFLMMGAVVFPVLLTIMTTIGSSPAIKQYMTVFAMFNPTFLAITYFVICPIFLVIFIYLIKASDPGA